MNTLDLALILAEVWQRPVSAMVPLVDPMREAMDLADITTEKRFAYWLAQIGHECGGGRWPREIWGPTAAQRRYERRFDQPWPTSPGQAKQPSYAANRLAYGLGNAFVGDGKRFMGRGWIQTTGRGNYRLATREFRELLGNDSPDFIADPERMERGVWVGLSAALYWRRRNLNQWADADDMLTLTRRINGGTNGLADRQAKFTRALATLAIRGPIILSANEDLYDIAA